MSPSSPPAAIPAGSLVVVTGATGYLGSHVALQFLQRGYRVRGTVRDVAKASWLTSGQFAPFAAQLELVHVGDLGAPRAFDAAVAGAAAVVHVASDMSFSNDPNEVIPRTVAGATGILEAAAAQPSVRRFVYTSSIVAAVMPMPGNDAVVGRDSWNDVATQMAWAPPPYDEGRSFPVYMASKIAAEKAVWEFAKQRRPAFDVSVISPSSIMGEPLDKRHANTLASFASIVYAGNDRARLEVLPAAIAVNVKDVALLHVAAVLDPEVKDARIQAWAQRCNWNDLLAIMRRLYPQKKFMDDFATSPELSVTSDFSQALALLKKWGGQDDWISLEDTVAQNLKPIVEWEASG